MIDLARFLIDSFGGGRNAGSDLLQPVMLSRANHRSLRLAQLAPRFGVGVDSILAGDHFKMLYQLVALGRVGGMLGLLAGRRRLSSLVFS